MRVTAGLNNTADYSQRLSNLHRPSELLYYKSITHMNSLSASPLSGWRKPLIGDALREFMCGDQNIRLLDNKLSIVSNEA